MTKNQSHLSCRGQKSEWASGCALFSFVRTATPLPEGILQEGLCTDPEMGVKGNGAAGKD